MPQAQSSPGAQVSDQAIRHVLMQDLVGPYDDPTQVPELDWVQRSASYAHVGNGQDGVHEFVLNTASAALDAPPERIAPVIERARQDGVAYLIFQQGT